jgi:pyrroline-5-carboxylate reductase
MKNQTVGFIGGGRVARIILNGWRRKGRLPAKVVVSDTNAEVLKALKAQFPEIKVIPNKNSLAASQGIVFVALHPPVLKETLTAVKPSLKPNTVLVSLAPRISLRDLSALSGLAKVVRMIPNAPSAVNEGYNPLAFSTAFSPSEKKDLLNFLEVLGKCPEVEEVKLEAYAMLTAMGPTYLWFQLYELEDLAQSFGLSAKEARRGIERMVMGSLKTMTRSGLSPAGVMDLIPVKPIGEAEEDIRRIYREKLTGLYNKLKR